MVFYETIALTQFQLSMKKCQSKEYKYSGVDNRRKEIYLRAQEEHLKINGKRNAATTKRNL